MMYFVKKEWTRTNGKNIYDYIFVVNQEVKITKIEENNMLILKQIKKKNKD